MTYDMCWKIFYKGSADCIVFNPRCIRCSSMFRCIWPCGSFWEFPLHWLSLILSKSCKTARKSVSSQLVTGWCTLLETNMPPTGRNLGVHDFSLSRLVGYVIVPLKDGFKTADGSSAKSNSKNYCSSLLLNRQVHIILLHPRNWTASVPLKNDGWKTILTFCGPAYFQGQDVICRKPHKSLKHGIDIANPQTYA